MDTSAVRVNSLNDFSAQATSEINQLINSATKAQEHLIVWEKTLTEKVNETEQMLDKQLAQIQSLVSQFQRTLQATSNQDLQQANAFVQNESKQQTNLLQDACDDLKKTTKDICARVERTGTQLTRGLNNTLQGLRPGELHQLVEDSSIEVKNFATNATHHMDKIVKWFHWKNLGAVLLLSLVVTILVSLYIDDEWPWESHKTVLKQRLAGQAVISLWPQLSLTDKQQIMSDVA